MDLLVFALVFLAGTLVGCLVGILATVRCLRTFASVSEPTKKTMPNDETTTIYFYKGKQTAHMLPRCSSGSRGKASDFIRILLFLP